MRTPNPSPNPKLKQCIIVGCTKPVTSRGTCRAHYHGNRGVIAESEGTANEITWEDLAAAGFCLLTLQGTVIAYKEQVRNVILRKRKRTRAKPNGKRK